MTAIALALVVFGLAMISFAITGDASPGRRTAAGSVGLAALVVALLLGVSRNDDDAPRRDC
jgi:hypothetical protein